MNYRGVNPGFLLPNLIIPLTSLMLWVLWFCYGGQVVETHPPQLLGEEIEGSSPFVTEL